MTNTKAEATATAEPTIEVDGEGREWSVRRITEFAPENPPTRSGLHGTFYAGKTDAEIADDLRGVRLRVGADGEAWEYREIHPDVARVAAALAKDRAGVRGHSAPGPNGDPVYVEETSASLSIPGRIGTQPSTSAPSYAASLSDAMATFLPSGADIEPASPYSFAPFSELTPLRAEGHRPAVGAPAGASPSEIFGTDDRQWVSHAAISTHWARTVLSITPQPWPGTDRCSAQMIGRATAISAAHCFWPLTAPGVPGTWASQRAWAAGVVQTNGTFGPQQTILYGPHNGCYWVTIPSAWTTGHINGYQAQDDWAVIDFVVNGCTITWPGDVVGRAGYYVNASNAQHVAASTWLGAYDQADPEPPQPPGSTHYVRPSVIARSKPAWSTAIEPGTNNTILATIVDTTRGFSGGGLLQNISAGSQFVGPVIMEDVTENIARHLDNNMWSFTQAHCWEY